MPQEEQLYTVFLRFDFYIYIIKPHPHCKLGEIQLWLIKTSSFCCLLVKEGILPGRYRERGYNSRYNSCWTLFCIKGFNSNELFQMIVKLKMSATGKIFGKICVKKLSEVPFFQVWSLRLRERDGVRHDACCLKQTSLDACSWNRAAMPQQKYIYSWKSNFT